MPEGIALEIARQGGSTQPQDDEGMNDRIDPSLSPEESHKQSHKQQIQHQDFDDGANDLWSLYGKEAQIFDESRIKTLKGDMGSILIFVRVYFPSG